MVGETMFPPPAPFFWWVTRPLLAWPPGRRSRPSAAIRRAPTLYERRYRAGEAGRGVGC